MPREITYSISTEYRNNQYNNTFRWGEVDQMYKYLGRYWDISFRRVTKSARIKIIQASTNPNSNWAAWTRGFETRISPVYNFQSNLYLCAKVACHEFGHMCRQDGSHASVQCLMSPNCDMPLGNFMMPDYRWFDVYARKPGAKRPHEEPNEMRKAFGAPIPASALPGMESASDTAMFGCPQEPKKRAWYDLRPDSWLLP